MNIGASMPALPLNIRVPPNHRTIAIVAVPKLAHGMSQRLAAGHRIRQQIKPLCPRPEARSHLFSALKALHYTEATDRFLYMLGSMPPHWVLKLKRLC